MSGQSTTSAESTDIETLPPFRSATSSPVERRREEKDSTESPRSAAETIVNVVLDYDGHDDSNKTKERIHGDDSEIEKEGARVHGRDNDLAPTVSAILSPPAPPTTTITAEAQPRDLRFWLVFVSICCSIFLSALDLTSVSTALPSSTCVP